MPPITDIEGIGEASAEKLRAAGIRTTDALLENGSTPKRREELAKTAGVSPKRLLGWINRADLYRVAGVGSQYSDLLEASGVDTVPELAKRKADALLDKMLTVNKKKNLVNKEPGLAQVQGWITAAKALKKVIKY